MCRLQDYMSTKARLQAENQDMGQQVEDYETQLTALSKRKAQCLAQLEDAKRTVVGSCVARIRLYATHALRVAGGGASGTPKLER